MRDPWSPRTVKAARKAIRVLTKTQTLLLHAGDPLLEAEAVALNERVQSLADLTDFMTTVPERP